MVIGANKGPLPMPSPAHRAPSAKVEIGPARLRAQGLPPVRVAVADTRSPAFVAEAHRQSQAVAAGAHAADGQGLRRCPRRALAGVRRGENRY